MANYDLFNGDADGICALIQLRLANPREATLVTGIKRDNALLKHISPKAGDNITVLDVSMKKNTAPLQAALAAGAKVFYVDHHQAGEIPQHENLQAHINTAANTCTSLIVNAYLKSRFEEWAIVAAFGDNITVVAEKLCEKAGYSAQQVDHLRTLGVCMNYNGYGASLDDLFYHPADLYRIASQYESPFNFIESEVDVFSKLKNGYEQDMKKALAVKAFQESEKSAMFILPNEKWARRVSGVLGNELANRFPARAHAVLTEHGGKYEGQNVNEGRIYQVSIRAPRNNPVGADEIAAKFGGGGRKGAAGVDVLQHSQINSLLACLYQE
ncbi:MAG: DHH family phosphoesterase [Colwellia sp.]